MTRYSSDRWAKWSDADPAVALGRLAIRREDSPSPSRMPQDGRNGPKLHPNPPRPRSRRLRFLRGASGSANYSSD
jgi:hypothetical protein